MAKGLAVLPLAGALFGLMAAAWLIRWVLRQEQGAPAMSAVSNAIRAGAQAFLHRQYRTVFVLAVPVAALLFAGYAFGPSGRGGEGLPGPLSAGAWTAGSFALGALGSALAGYGGMWVSVHANVRTAHAALTSLAGALRIALRAGAVSGLLVASTSLLGIVGLFLAARTAGIEPTRIPLVIVGYGLGASFVALFAQLGGGVYTKAADVGADLAGKVEAGIPEDDPRNPAVIADLVGDNVGDCAGRGADLFESISAESLGAMILGGALAASMERAGTTFAGGTAGVTLFPLVVHSAGIAGAVVGVVATRLGSASDPMRALNRGYALALAVAFGAFVAACRWLLDASAAPNAWWHFALCGATGAASGIALVVLTQYYTQHRFRPVRSIAEAAETGPATNVIAGLGVAFESVGLPALVLGAALVASFWLGATSGVPGAGVLGTAVATLGMLATAPYVLAMDAFGPISDNAGGIVEMSDAPETARANTDRLDAVGNTTKALTKGYAVGSAALAAFLLLQAYADEIGELAGKPLVIVNLANPLVFVAGLLGAALVFVFSALSIRAVGTSARDVVAEVRRQFSELPREDGTIRFPPGFVPDYRACVDIVTRSALRKMVAPGLLAVLGPIVVGLGMRPFAGVHHPLIAAEAVAGLVIVATIVGILVALALNTGGGAWDNAKKYVEAGAHGGKYLDLPGGERTHNPVHAAAVVGDTVGDPCKDTAGPSLHVLVKLLSTLILVLAPWFL